MQSQIRRNTGKIEYTCVRYILDEDEDIFVPQGEKSFTPQEAHRLLAKGGLSSEEADETLARCGQNEIHVHVPGICEALATEFFDFTYIFNSIGTWSYIVNSTWNIGAIWMFMIVGSGLYRALFIIRPNMQKIAAMAAMDQSCKVLRDGEWQEVEASDIVVGDIVLNEDGEDAKLPADGLIVSGGLVVNESMLTGEPMPISKAPLEDAQHAQVTEKLNKAYAGTLSLESTGQHQGKSCMVVTNIGALTTRGQLVRMVLFPSSVRFKYLDQLPIVYGILSIYMIVLIPIYLFLTNLGSVVATYLIILNTVAMCLSPMLPVSMVIGQSVSATRLTDKDNYDIKCLQPGRIPIAGKISNMVFDKTGTITKGGMDFAGIIGVQDSKFLTRVEFNPNDPECDANREACSKLPESLRYATASCHTVKQLRDGTLVGNSVECAMVKTSGWELTDSGVTSADGKETCQVLKQLEFDHHRMTSGAVIKDPKGKITVFIKGSYEKIRDISEKKSRPADYEKVTQGCAKDNYYTLGIATKTLGNANEASLKNMKREEFETGLNICGLLLFRNEMKADSPEAIRQLKEGGIRSVICTGDNELTGIAIGKKVGIVTTDRCLKGDLVNGKLTWTDPDDDSGLGASPQEDSSCNLAVTCPAWRYLLKNRDTELEEIWGRIVVFARMKPDDKINVVRYLQSRGFVVGMAGDGGNDCGGLRAAHAGLALSDAEASMVSPFSTGRLGEGEASADITLCTVPDLIREGRACLATNLATFMYFLVYSFVVTIIRTMLTVLRGMSMGEWVWITMDMGIGVIMMSFMTKSRATEQLSAIRPTATLLGCRTVAGIAFPVITASLVQVIALLVLYSQPWYDAVDPFVDLAVRPQDWMKKGDNYESATSVVIVLLTLSTTAYVMTYGGSFRKNICWNFGINITYVIFIIMLSTLNITTPNVFNCVFRVNCDTTKSVDAGNIPVLPLVSVGGIGGCFLGPQNKAWQNQTGDDVWGKFPYRPPSADVVSATNPGGYWPEDWNTTRTQLCDVAGLGLTGECLLPKWQPVPSTMPVCNPPPQTLVTIPENSSIITTGMNVTLPDCYGPNNCWSSWYKWFFFGSMVLLTLLNHFFKKFVMLGPVATGIRKWQKSRDKEHYTEMANQLDSEDEDEDEEESDEDENKRIAGRLRGE